MHVGPHFFVGADGNITSPQMAELARRPPNHVGLDRSIDCAASSGTPPRRGTCISSGPRSAAAERRRRAARAAANPGRVTPESSRSALKTLA